MIPQHADAMFKRQEGGSFVAETRATEGSASSADAQPDCSCCHVPNTVISLPQHTYYMQSLLGLLATLDTDVRPGRFLAEDALANYAVVSGPC